MKTLLINVTERESWVCFFDGTKITKTKKWNTTRVSGEILENIWKVLGDQKPEKIIIVTGPGPFTQVRVGVIVANSLAQVWNIKIVGLSGLYSPEELLKEGLNKKGTDLVKPYYLHAPNITKPKKI